MRRYFLAALLPILWIPPIVAAGPAEGADSVDFFERRVRPVLAKHCYACHTESQLGGLRLDSREGLLKGGKSGAGVVPGDPDQSTFMQAVRGTHSRKPMPPQGKLPAQAIADLAEWVKAGALWPVAPISAIPEKMGEYRISAEQRAFWAFQPIAKLAPPRVKQQARVLSPIDRFILAKLEQNGIEPVRPADKRTLIRRATFDLIGLPPTIEDVDAFVADLSPHAFQKVVDRLLASPHYGERWGRHWLDLARYADGQLGASNDTPYLNAFRYRDWVVQAFNDDLPYDQFVKAQIAADLLPSNREKLLPGLGFQALGHSADDQVDVTTRVFLGLTVGCAQCHDHKYDPIPTKDYYSLLGVFKSSGSHPFPLAAKETVEAWDGHKQKIESVKEGIDDFIQKQSTELSAILATKTSRYMVAAWKVMSGRIADVADAAAEDQLDGEILERWIRFSKEPKRDYPYLKAWDAQLAKGAANGVETDIKKTADEFQEFVIALFAEQKAIEDRNYVKLGGAKGVKDEKTRQYTNVESLEPLKFYLWRDLASEPYSREGLRFRGGVYYYGNARATGTPERPLKNVGDRKDIERFLSGEWREFLIAKRAELRRLESSLPPQYPFLHTLRDKDKPANAKVAIRGDAQNLGEEAPRRFLKVLSAGEAKPFTQGSGRLELAEAIANPENPLTARVMANRLWQWHFGKGIVPSPSNFGQLGERPSHPELLDYLAARLIESGWSIKAIHREIMMSAAYALSADHSEENAAKDPENRLMWRANMRLRLDAEALRDSMLAVAGALDRKVGGVPVALDEETRRRTLYGYVGRTKRDPTLALFDFPNPIASSELRTVTVGPLQRLYFMNNGFVIRQARAFAERLRNEVPKGDAERIHRAYRILFGRPASETDMQLGREFLEHSKGSWEQYVQVLIASSEFSSVN